MNKQEKRFYDSFMIVIGIFTGLILGIVFTKAFAEPVNIEDDSSQILLTNHAEYKIP